MPDYDVGFKIVAHLAGRQLAELGGIHCQEWEPIRGEVQATERLADRAFRATNGPDRFVVYMEAYTRWQAAAPWSILAKSGLLSERERLPTVSLLYVLLRRGYHSHAGTFRLNVAAEPTQQVWFREICLWQQEPQPAWENAPGLMALYPLCRHRRPRREAISYPAQVIAGSVSDRSIRADLLTTLGFFGRLTYPGIPVFDWIGREQMKESTFFQEIMQEGELKAQRAAILAALKIRFGPEAAAEFTTAVQDVDDSTRLTELHELAIRCRRLSEFRRAWPARN